MNADEKAVLREAVIDLTTTADAIADANINGFGNQLRVVISHIKTLLSAPEVCVSMKPHIAAKVRPAIPLIKRALQYTKRKNLGFCTIEPDVLQLFMDIFR